MVKKNNSKKLQKVVDELKETLQIKNIDEKQVERIEHKLFKMLWTKHYLDECEPEYCVFRITESCEYIKTLKKINKEIDKE